VKSSPDTIFALATPPGIGGVGIIRVSGQGALGAVLSLTGDEPPEPRRASLRRLRDPASGRVLDEALLLFFPAPNSFTGEDVAEFHIHGGRAVANGLLGALARLPCLRLARPGEFTRRGFENGRFDLTRAEAIHDLIRAETELQADQALSQLGGELAALYEGWARRLSRALAHIEADLEFPDEDLPPDAGLAAAPDLKDILADMTAHLADNRRGERLRDGFSIALIGAPNAGKSSLLNKLARRDAAIVSERAGTTRDIIEVHLDLGGWPVTLIDTAGLRDTEDEIEAEGIARTRARAKNADLKLALFDSAHYPARDSATDSLVDDNTLVIWTKSDLSAQRPEGGAFTVSARSGAGLDIMLSKLTAEISSRFDARPGPSLTRARHREALEEASACLSRALEAPLPELAAEDCRMALRALGRITGRVDVEDLLDIVFRDFCIGK
jgi:tRNA modification GTPase